MLKNLLEQLLQMRAPKSRPCGLAALSGYVFEFTVLRSSVDAKKWRIVVPSMFVTHTAAVIVFGTLGLKEM
jgi:hypothetical protein